MKLKIYKTVFIILIILEIIVTALIAIKYGRNQQYEKENKEAIETFSRDLESRKCEYRNEWI